MQHTKKIAYIDTLLSKIVSTVECSIHILQHLQKVSWWYYRLTFLIIKNIYTKKLENTKDALCRTHRNCSYGLDCLPFLQFIVWTIHSRTFRIHQKPYYNRAIVNWLKITPLQSTDSCSLRRTHFLSIIWYFKTRRWDNSKMIIIIHHHMIVG